MRVKDLTGEQFGRLTVLKRVGTAKNGNAVWECRCSCGRTVAVDGYRLRSAQVRSCGCLRREVARERAASNPAFRAHQHAHGRDLTNDEGISLNSLVRSKRNKSGVVGVSYNPTNNRWFARLRYQGKYVLLKSCETFDEAVALRKAAESRYLGKPTEELAQSVQ